MHQVDSHNVVPLWVASDKQEYAARTIRPKINRVLHEWLVDYPALPSPAFGAAWDKPIPCSVDWEVHIKHACSAGDSANVRPLEWCHGGESAGKEALKDFLSEKRLSTYDTSRNDPTKPSAVSNLSPWINFGFLSAQRAAYAAKRLRAAAPKYAKAIDGFTEELVIRRELSDNFCYHNEHYDAVAGASQWAQDSLRLHAADKREHLYTESQFERAATHDDLWNAAQLELVYHGKMHGFMRMYWCVAPLPLCLFFLRSRRELNNDDADHPMLLAHARVSMDRTRAKKILEWSESPEEALRIAILLNDKYSLDGRDPNGYVGCMWSVCGIHDMGWTERNVFGKIRYMNYNGCKRKFNVTGYIGRINKMVFDSKKQFKQQGVLAK